MKREIESMGSKSGVDIIKILKENIVASKKESSQPKVILLGGLPGAGKTQLCNSVLKENSPREFVVIDVDDYRKYTPDLDKNYIPTTEMVNKTASFCNKVADELLEYALQERKDIIVNTTLRETDLILNFINDRFMPLGYEIDICMLATTIEESFISAQERYEEQLEEGEVARFTTMTFIKDSDEKISETIGKLGRLSSVHSIKVFKRGEGEVDYPILVYGSNQQLKTYSSAEEAIDDCKKKEKLKENPKKQLSRIKEVYLKRKDRNATCEEFQELLLLIHSYENNKELEKEM